ncbi:E3 ubiquitin-protein ligase herc2, partial [Bonamia ostreae]
TTDRFFLGAPTSSGSWGEATKSFEHIFRYCERPASVEGLEGVAVVHITTGDNFSACLSDKGEVFTWGDNFNGQLGHGDEKDRVWSINTKNRRERRRK